MSSLLFTPAAFRDITLRNRIVVAPMCEYSSVDGFSNDWHFVHLGSRAVGGAGLIITEATAVEARGRISPEDLGIYLDEHVEGLARINAFMKGHGATTGIQLAHAGRKASTFRPWSGHGAVPQDQGGWQTIGPSAIPFSDVYPIPTALSLGGIAEVVAAFRTAAERSLAAGFDLIELHAAHGYLLHQFMSPISNKRTDGYGGSFMNRCRLTIETVRAIREVWPERLPLFVRISASDWTDGGWDLEQSVDLAKLLQRLGVDLIDCSSGGNVSHAKIEVGPGYQVPFAAEIRRQTGIPTGAVGLITSPLQAENIVRTGQADLVFLAREFLRDPYWPRRAAKELGAEIHPPAQYARAW